MRLSLLLAVALVLTLGGYAAGRAQSNDTKSIELGGVTLRLGMARDSAIAGLSKNYNVDDNGIVTTKSGPPYDAIGSISFKNGKLSGVWKNWSPDDQQHGYEFANNLYGLFNRLEKEGRTNCTLSTGTNQDNRGENKTAFLFCGEKEIDIGAIRYQQPDGNMRAAAMLTEILKASD